ncbi:hypothetical protein [Marinobacterium arenosum]|uniref:hypothetical protein n=1 Tax=Marinobacterium arenosum TaxID=2862496 RepID=UPI001C94582A|nr:hypothetical protein [Marinobacterium arenosum]MBY4677610.1 hypothetical protein [Marinobacterium arenosum]
MNANVDFQKPFETVQKLMNLQAEAMTKAFEQQQKSGQQLTSFFQSEAEKAKQLKTPEEVIKFNIDANKALFELLKNQGEAFTTIANDAREAAMAELQNITK